MLKHEILKDLINRETPEGMDYEVYQTAQELINENQWEALSYRVSRLDTVPRDAIILAVCKFFGKDEMEALFNVTILK